MHHSDSLSRIPASCKIHLDTYPGHLRQFGSGLVLRSYEDKGLGIDHSLDGIRLKYVPINGLYVTGLIGKSRTYFEYSIF